MNFKLKAALAAVAMAASVGASASTTSVFEITNGSFAESYFFSIGSTSNLIGDVNSSGITWGNVTLSNSAISYSASDFAPDDGFAFNSLSAGSYTLTFSGSGTGGFGGYFTVAAAPVPEPETYAMMLAGLGAIGFMARRRQAK